MVNRQRSEPVSACGHEGSYVLTTWAPVYVTVEGGQVTRVRVNDEALDVAGLAGPGPAASGAAGRGLASGADGGLASVVTCAVCDRPVDPATAGAVRAAADACSDWPGWELGA